MGFSRARVLGGGYAAFPVAGNWNEGTKAAGVLAKQGKAFIRLRGMPSGKHRDR